LEGKVNMTTPMRTVGTRATLDMFGPGTMAREISIPIGYSTTSKYVDFTSYSKYIVDRFAPIWSAVVINF